MTCAEIQELLSDFLDDELSAGARAGVEAHLASCEACAREYRALKRTVRFVRANASTPIVLGTPGDGYSAFTRALMDPSFGRKETDVIDDWGLRRQ